MVILKMILYYILALFALAGIFFLLSTLKKGDEEMRLMAILYLAIGFGFSLLGVLINGN